MNRLVHIAVASALLVFGAAAQDPEAMAKAKTKAEAEALAQMVQMKVVGAGKGMTVKGAPYSAEEVNETNQTLADGTRIHRENRTTVYRDSEGRTRRETPENITITDPVANVTYLLDPKSMTGQKVAMSAGTVQFSRIAKPGDHASGESTTSTFSIHSSAEGPTSIIVNGVPLDEKAVAETMAKAKTSGSTQTVTYETREIFTSSSSGGAGTAMAGGVTMMTSAKVPVKKNAGESLGKQTIEGVTAEGTRSVITLDAGAIGNDRPIQITGESWYSAELQMVVLSKHSDPRTGEESFRLTNIRKGEPGAYLFQAPAGYQINERK